MNVMHNHSVARASVVQVFCRPYLVDEFRANFAALDGQFDIHFLCDGHAPGTTDTREVFYRHWRQRDVSPLLTPSEIDDCLTRCRLLRNIARADAMRMVHAMALSLETHLAASNPHVVICHMVDEYVTHLLSILARKRGILYLGYIYSYFPGYVQVVQGSDGQGFDVREPTDEEAQDIVARFSKGRFRQNYAQKKRGTVARQLKAMFRYRVKLAYFWLKGRWERDPLNLHYQITPHIAEYRHLRDLPSTDQFSADWEQQIAKAKSEGGKVVFLPLAYFPESAVDFWVGDISIIKYDDATIEMVEALASDFAVAIKEHPHMVGARDCRLYRRLASIKGVIMVPPDAYATDLMDDCDAVLLGGGSGGVEATLRGKPVFSYCDTSYWFAASKATFLDLGKIKTWPELIMNTLSNTVERTDADRLAFAKACLRSTMRARGVGGRWPLCNKYDLVLALNKAMSLRSRDTRT